MTMEIKKPKGKYKKCTYSDPFIYVKDGVLSEKFCSEVIEKFEGDDNKYQGVTGSGLSEDVKQSMDLSITRLSDWKKEDEIFCKSIKKYGTKYLKKITKIGFTDHTHRNNIFQDTGYQIQRTDPGGFYVFHHDFSYSNLRHFTFIWYLNDINNDGYTEFIDGTRIQPKTGRLLIFPATWTYMHRGYPPKNETKYICTGWISV